MLSAAAPGPKVRKIQSNRIIGFRCRKSVLLASIDIDFYSHFSMNALMNALIHRSLSTPSSLRVPARSVPVTT
jgi:hypothetical protein